MTDYVALLPEDKHAIREAVQLIKRHPGLLTELENLAADREIKHHLIDQTVPEGLRPLCKVLSDNNDIALLPDLLGYALGKPLDPDVPTAQVLYAKAPTDEQRRGLKRFIKQQLDAEHVRIIYKKEPSILGGFIVRVAGLELDYSLRGRLSAIERAVSSSTGDFETPDS